MFVRTCELARSETIFIGEQWMNKFPKALWPNEKWSRQCLRVYLINASVCAILLCMYFVSTFILCLCVDCLLLLNTQNLGRNK